MIIDTLISHLWEHSTWDMKVLADHCHCQDQTPYMETRVNSCCYWDSSWYFHAGPSQERIKKMHSELTQRLQTDTHYSNKMKNRDTYQSGHSERHGCDGKSLSKLLMLQFI